MPLYFLRCYMLQSFHFISFSRNFVRFTRKYILLNLSAENLPSSIHCRFTLANHRRFRLRSTSQASFYSISLSLTRSCFPSSQQFTRNLNPCRFGASSSLNFATSVEKMAMSSTVGQACNGDSSRETPKALPLKSKTAATHSKSEKLQEASKEVDPTHYFQNRSLAIEEWKKLGLPVYPHKFHVESTIPAFIEKYSYLADGQHLEEISLSLAGRIMRIAASGNKLRFYDLYGDGAKIQVIGNLRFHNPEAIDFVQMYDCVKRGDIVGINGFPGKSLRGELSIFARDLVILSPCLHMLPDKSGLKDPEVRYRQRYLDLIVNPFVRETLSIRTKIIKFLREILEREGFTEVETPILNPIVGGASARPFTTFHIDLNTNLYLRIATELYLKTLVVGGIQKVFEIGKNFRNEGIDLTHNPEFTACEFYWAYADYNDLILFTESLVSEIVLRTKGTYKVLYHPNGPEEEAIEIDFEPPYVKLSLIEELERCSGVQFPRPLDSEETIQTMKVLLAKEGVELPSPPTAPKLIDQLCGHFIETSITNKPTFIMNHPQIMSPLAKWHRSEAELTERFELFICGKEICNAYTELNDPAFQRKCFMDQAKMKAAGDVEACLIDEDYCTALEYGLPPTAGWGIGIDRVAMFLSDNFNIKEVIAFPAMRPLANTSTATANQRNASLTNEENTCSDGVKTQDPSL